MNKFILQPNKDLSKIKQINCNANKVDTKTRVNALGLRHYTVNSLLMNNIYTLEDLTLLTRSELLSLPNIHGSDVCRIDEILCLKGLYFADETKR